MQAMANRKRDQEVAPGARAKDGIKTQSHCVVLPGWDDIHLL
jgi:hypothetical protein